MDILRLLALGLALGAALQGCASINIDRAAQRPASHAIAQDTPSRLQELARKLAPAQPGESSLVLLDSGLDALAARLWLAQRADKTLDVQYYIFHGDKTGALVAEALMKAAERGVRVRVLLDDIYTYKNEASILAIDSHPNIEIRLFNPFHYRGGNVLLQLGQYLGNDKLNRRMHNKLFAADNQFAITGGRNIGDEYFLANSELDFVDLDVMASGPVVAELSASFDDYWASAAVVPARAMPHYKDARNRLSEVEAALQKQSEELAASDYGRALASLRFEDRLLAGELPAYHGEARVVADPPEKALGKARGGQLVMGQLIGEGAISKEELMVISPYFVPGRTGMDWFAYLRAHGVKVRVLTNSLAASDVPIVHAGYAKYRKGLLGMGVDLYELKPLPTARRQKPRLIGSVSSRSSLHAKSLVFDRQRVFIGSFNFDPRSARLNTEMGLVIRSPAAAARVEEMAEQAMDPSRSHHLELSGNSRILWVGETDKGETRTEVEPDSSWWDRLKLDLLGLLPLEEHL